MAEKNNRFDEISDQLDENILAVKASPERMDFPLFATQKSEKVAG